MNKINAKRCKSSYGYEEFDIFIDNKSLKEYLDDWVKESADEYFKAIAPFDDLYPAWSIDIENEGDVRFVWKTIDMNRAVVPLLLCPDDTDFSCIVIVAEVEKIGECVYWDRIGYVLHDNEDFEEEKKRGILYIDAYNDEDWEEYGDNIALETADSPEWWQWISENWSEELYRRRINYTLPYYQAEGNICWIKTTDWIFNRREYDEMIDLYWDMQVINQQISYKNTNQLNKADCATFIANLTRDGRTMLKQHIRDYNEILLHVLAAELVEMPLIDFLKNSLKRKIQVYCNAIEYMWKCGDEEVVNVVDVTILEGLSDNEDVWEAFGENISNEFIKYINEEVLVNNLMMCGVRPLKLNKNVN